jgi:hypothetical protein
MTSFPEPPIDFSNINEIIIQPIRSRLLRTGMEMEIFNRLCRSCTAREVSDMMGSHEENTEHLLDGLTSMGLVEKHHGRYRNAQVANTYLVKGKDTYLGEFFDEYQKDLVDALDNLTDMVRHGPFLPKEGSGIIEPDHFERYASALANTARGGSAQMITRIVSELPTSVREGRLLDIGGGPGIIDVAILEDNPSMTGVLFERPGMARFALENIR